MTIENVGWYNVQIGHPVDKHVYMIIKRFKDEKPTWLGLTEIREYLDVLKVEAGKAGLKVVSLKVPGSPQAENQAFLVRSDVEVGKVWSVVAGVAYTAPNGDVRRAHMPLIAELNGKLVMMIHAPVKSWVNDKGKWQFIGGAKRLLAYQKFVSRTTQVFKAHPYKEIWVVGDWNSTPDVRGLWSPNYLRRITGSSWVRPHAGTHGAGSGGSEIDFGIRRAAKGQRLARTTCKVLSDPMGLAHSDHRMVKAVIGVSAPVGDAPIKTKFTGPTIDGVDLSHYQSGKIDWVAAKKAGVRFMYHKCTEDSDVKDAEFAGRRAEAKKAGVPFGAYHFARASRAAGDGTRQAKFFLSVAKPVDGDLKPMLDLETTEGLNMVQLKVWAGEFIAEVKRQTGVEPILYTPYDLGKLSDGTLLWRARYNNSNMEPVGNWDIWQFSNGELGRPNAVDGIGHCDINTVRAGLKMSDLLL